jgi:hypothetical protein
MRLPKSLSLKAATFLTKHLPDATPRHPKAVKRVHPPDLRPSQLARPSNASASYRHNFEAVRAALAACHMLSCTLRATEAARVLQRVCVYSATTRARGRGGRAGAGRTSARRCQVKRATVRGHAKQGAGAGC